MGVVGDDSGTHVAGRSAKARQLPILAVTGLAREARLIAGSGFATIGAGGNSVRLKDMLDARVSPGCSAVVSIGIAGGLDPILVPGDIVIATGIVAEHEYHPIREDIVAFLAGGVSGTRNKLMLADIAGVNIPALTPAAKSALRRKTGAAAVDMESHVAAAFATKHRLPFAVVRAICDPAHRALPAFVLRALQPSGHVDIMAIVASAITRSATISDLFQLSRDSAKAFEALRHWRMALDLSFPSFGEFLDKVPQTDKCDGLINGLGTTIQSRMA